MGLIPPKRFSILPWVLIAAASLLLSLVLVEKWEAGQVFAEAQNTLSLQGYAYAEPSTEQSSRKIFRKEGMAVAEYRFKEFNNRFIQIKISMPVEQLEKYCGEYGYTQADLDSLFEWQKKALKDAYQYVVAHSLAQSDLDRMSSEIKDAFRQKVSDLYASRGFRYKKKGLLVPDIPGIVKRNVRNLSSVALDINTIAKANNYDALDVIGAVLSFLQTGVEYESVPMRKQDRTIGGFYPPLVTIVEGRGDCDSKTALMASILLNWDKAKLIGAGIPNHYLIGVLRTPAKGDAYVEYEGLHYVLMEPAGPSQMAPGIISDYTRELLNAVDQASLEPLLKN
jgi:hypothetical protein